MLKKKIKKKQKLKTKNSRIKNFRNSTKKIRKNSGGSFLSGLSGLCNTNERVTSYDYITRIPTLFTVSKYSFGYCPYWYCASRKTKPPYKVCAEYVGTIGSTNNYKCPLCGTKGQFFSFYLF